MARYSEDFDRSSAFGQNRGSQLDRGAWNRGYDSDFGSPRGYRSYGSGSGAGGFGRSGAGNFRGYGSGEWDRGNRFGGGSHGGMRSGGYGMRDDKGWARGYGDDDRWSGGYRGGSGYGGSRGMYDRGYRSGGFRSDYDRDLGDRMREGWHDFKREMRRTFGGERYDQRW